jgi:uncharacterized membrane protein
VTVALRRLRHPTWLARASAAILVLTLAGTLAPATLAVTGLEVSTPFPAVRVEPGGTASFELTIDVTTDRRVDLAIDGVPSGWTATFRGGGAVIDSAFVKASSSPEITLDVEVPEGTAGGSNRLTVQASSNDLRETLAVDVRVAEQAAGDITLTTDNPEVEGSSDETFTFSLELQNDTPGDIVFRFAGTGPTGWDVTATPSGESQASSVNVPAGGTQAVNVSIDPPDDVAAAPDPYPIQVTATGGDKSVTSDLSVRITGSFGMTLSTPNQVLSTNANAGTAKQLSFTILNTGTSPLTNVVLSAPTLPTGWTFTPQDPIAEIAPSEEATTMTATLTPANEAIAGDYALQIRATAAEETQNVAYRVTIETPQIWGIIGIGLLVAVLGGLYWVFRTYGRR